MQLIKKPEIDLVLKAQKGAARQEVKQKDRYIENFKTHSCLKDFETVNFETLNPKMRFLFHTIPAPYLVMPARLKSKA